MYKDRDILKRSVPVFLIFLGILLIVAMITKHIEYALGLVLGYVINIVIFKVITLTVDALLTLGNKTSVVLVMFSFFIRLFIYGIGFYIAVKFPSFFSLFTVALGYFMIKLSVHIGDYWVRKRGEDG